MRIEGKSTQKPNERGHLALTGEKGPHGCAKEDGGVT